MSKTIDKSLTKKLLDDVIVKDEPKVDVYKSTYPEPSYVQGGRGHEGSWMDDWDRSHGWRDDLHNADVDHGDAFGLGQDYTSAKAVVDGNRSGGKVIELDRHDTDEVIGLLD